MTIKWVKVDPLVMNGEPFCYATRLSVRNLLEMRANGLSPAAILAQNPELRRVGIAEAFRYAADNRARYADFLLRTRSTTLPVGTDDGGRIGDLACSLLDRALADRPGLLRLVSVGVSGLEDHRQLELLPETLTTP